MGHWLCRLRLLLVLQRRRLQYDLPVWTVMLVLLVGLRPQLLLGVRWLRLPSLQLLYLRVVGLQGRRCMRLGVMLRHEGLAARWG